jgi:hypothetical protein
VRLAFFLLLLANVGYFAWANWIDTPAPRARPQTGLPELLLAEEPRGQAGTAGRATPMPAVAEAPARCVSVGPFDDLAGAARAAATLQERGLKTRQRAEEGAGWTGYWVYLGGLANRDEQTRALRRLERGGIDDAHAMSEAGEGRRISLGVFSERSRADRRARAVSKLGLQAKVAERTQPGAVYWIDFDLAPRDSAIAAEGLLSSNASGSRIEIRACPTTIERPVLANTPR